MKRILSLILALVLVIGLTPAVLAASPKITALIKDLDSNGIFSSKDKASVNLDQVKYGDTLYIYLTQDMFEWDDGVARSVTAITSTQTSDGKLRLTTSSKSSAVSSVTLARGTEKSVTGSSTARIEIKFKEMGSTTKEEDFNLECYLSAGGQAQKDYTLSLSGSMQYDAKYVDSDNDYIDISNGEVIEADRLVRNVELELGEGVVVKTNLTKGKKVRGSAEDITSNEEKTIDKYPAIFAVLKVSVTGITTSSAKVKIENSGDGYVYASDGKYLGREGSWVAYSSKYYVADERISMNSSSSGSSGSSSSKASSSTAPATSSGSSAATSGAAVSVATAQSQAQAAVKAGSRSVRFQDASSITMGALQAVQKASANLVVYADSMSGSAVRGRLSIIPSRAESLTASNSINLGVYVDDASTQTTKSFFERWFSNKLTAISLAQKSGFGFTVEVVAKVDLSGMSTQNLKFYSYNKSTNQYTQLLNTGYYIDTNGYLHLNTSLGGEIVITDGTLKSK